MLIRSSKYARIIAYSVLIAIALFYVKSSDFSYASEQNTSQTSSICQITIAILKREIALERFLLKYKILGNKEPKLRQLRYFKRLSRLVCLRILTHLC